MNSVKLKNYEIANNLPLTLIAGPCVIENEEMAFLIASKIKEITNKLGINYIFKASYKKANRTSLGSFTGIKEEEAIKILGNIKRELDLPVITDIHTNEEVALASQIADILQIPAFLCRQTELLLEAGKTGKIINIKKGQFLYPGDMKYAAEKIESTNNKNILFTERGTTFGYNNLVVDMRSLVIMKELGYPVIMDATHSVQMPGKDGITGGDAKFIKPLAKSAIAIGIAALFLEVHHDPKNAKSDAASQLPLNEIEKLLVEVKQIDDIVKKEV